MALAHDRGRKAEGDVRNRASGEHKSWGRGIPGPGTGKPGSGREGLARGYTTAGPEGESQQVMEAPSEGTTSGSGADTQGAKAKEEGDLGPHLTSRELSALTSTGFGVLGLQKQTLRTEEMIS